MRFESRDLDKTINACQSSSTTTFSLQVIEIIELIINEKSYLLKKTNDIYNLKTRKNSILLDFCTYFC